MKLDPQSHDPSLYLVRYTVTQPHLSCAHVSNGQPGAMGSLGAKCMQLAGFRDGVRQMPVVFRSLCVSADCISMMLIESAELSRHTFDFGQHYFVLHWNPY